MSNEELIGKFGEQYRSAKEQLTQKQAEARHHAQTLKRLTDFLNQMAGQPLSGINADEHVKDYPTREQVAAVLSEMTTLSDQMKSAQKQLKQLGIEVK